MIPALRHAKRQRATELAEDVPAELEHAVTRQRRRRADCRARQWHWSLPADVSGWGDKHSAAGGPTEAASATRCHAFKSRAHRLDVNALARHSAGMDDPRAAAD